MKKYVISGFSLLSIVFVCRAGFPAPDCTKLSDGFYEFEDGCSDKYYKCLTGARTQLQCPSGKKFHQPTETCTSNDNHILGCQCQADSYQYVGDANTCVLSHAELKKNWEEAYNYCTEKAKIWFYNATEIHGRLVHIITNDMAIGAKDGANALNHDHYIGMRALSGTTSTNKADYHWWLSVTNENAVKPVGKWAADMNEVLDEDVDHANEFCGATKDQKFKDFRCTDKKRIMCEYFYDRCAVKNPCSAPKQCVPDSYFSTMCVCPEGLPDTDDCGLSCTGQGSGEFMISKCFQHYYSCDASETIAFQSCPPGQAYEAGSLCVPENEAFSCACDQVGKFVESTQSCIVGSDDSMNWKPSYQQCIDDATTLFANFPNVAGRLAHVTNDDVASVVNDLAGNDHYFIGGASCCPWDTGKTDLSGLRWWFDPGNNEQAVDPVLLGMDNLTEIVDQTLGNDGKNCIYMDDAEFKEEECDKGKGRMCEFLYNACNSSTCPSPSICYPDVKAKTRCFCPSGQPNCMPQPCVPSPCQNGGTCITEPGYTYTCECAGNYYGNDCENYCDTNATNPWSTCSRTCDYGIQYKEKGKEINRTKIPSEQCVDVGYDFQSCQTGPCQTQSVMEETECNAKKGFYTKADCFFLAQTTPVAGITWAQAHTLCQDKGAQLAVIADTVEAKEALFGYVLRKKPNGHVWVSFKATDPGDGKIFGEWMRNDLSAVSIAVQNNKAEGCAVIKHLASTPSNNPNGKQFIIQNCNINKWWALCQKRTPYAEFDVNVGKKIMMKDGTSPEISTESRAWMCGLRCRRAELCLAHAYSSGGICELYKVKEGLPKNITSNGNVKEIYEIVSDSAWNLYNRHY